MYMQMVDKREEKDGGERGGEEGERGQDDGGREKEGKEISRIKTTGTTQDCL